MKLQRIIIFSVVLLDIIGISVLIPALPELKMYYGVGDFEITLGLTVYSLCAFLASPLMGQISDKRGRKRPLIRCISGTVLSYVLLLLSQQYWIFLLSRIINGITGGNIAILQAILTDMSPNKEEKSKNFGLMGALFGVGFIIGPLIGSLLLKFGTIETMFWFGAIFALIEVLLLVVHFKSDYIADRSKVLVYNSFQTIKKYFSMPVMSRWLWSVFLLGIGGFIINAGMSLFMNNGFGTSGEQYGYMLAFAGLLSAINMGYLVPHFWTKKFSNHFLIVLAHIVLILGYGLVGLSTNIVIFLALFYSVILLSGMYMAVYNIEIMSKAQSDQIGEVSGMLSGIQSMTMFIGPLLSGILLHFQFNIFRGAVIFFILSGLVMLKYELQAD